MRRRFSAFRGCAKARAVVHLSDYLSDLCPQTLNTSKTNWQVTSIILIDSLWLSCTYIRFNRTLDSCSVKYIRRENTKTPWMC